jgi:hypothetical protein
MRTNVDRLGLHAERQRFAGAIDHRPALRQHNPFFQVLPLPQAHELVALHHLELKRTTANGQEYHQK